MRVAPALVHSDTRRGEDLGKRCDHLQGLVGKSDSALDGEHESTSGPRADDRSNGPDRMAIDGAVVQSDHRAREHIDEQQAISRRVPQRALAVEGDRIADLPGLHGRSPSASSALAAVASVISEWMRPDRSAARIAAALRDPPATPTTSGMRRNWSALAARQ